MGYEIDMYSDKDRLITVWYKKPIWEHSIKDIEYIACDPETCEHVPPKS